MLSKKFQLWKYLFVLLLICSLFSAGPGAAKSDLQQGRPNRPAQELRNLVNRGELASRYRPGEAGTDTDLSQPASPLLDVTWSDLVFQSYRDDSWKLYLFRADGSGEMKYAGIEGTSLYPALQKNGQQIAFVNTVTGNQEIYAMARDGSSLRRLTDTPASDTLPTWSPDGSRIAFQSNRAGSSDIYVMDAYGNSLTLLAGSYVYDGEPGWSPDGKQIVFVSNRSGNYDLWMMNADGSNQHQVTFGGNTMGPVWSPKGDTIAFSNDGDGNGFYELWAVDPEGSNSRKLPVTASYNYDFWAPVWSPDGEMLAFIKTYWMEYYGNWYWFNSYLHISYLNGGDQRLIEDDTIWHADWAANDPLQPGPCTVIPDSQARWSDLAVRFSAQDLGTSGIYAYDAQFRKPGGTWQDLASWIRSDGAIYSGEALGLAEFRCRAYDLAGNAGDWSPVTGVSPVVDALTPTSRITPVNDLIRGKEVTLTWTGEDQGSGIASYDIYYKDGLNGKWTLWMSKTTATQATFTGESGHTYYFRSQAYDKAGHPQPWQPEVQATVTFYSAALDLKITDPRGLVVPFSEISLQPSPVITQVGSSPGVFHYLLRESPQQSLGVVYPGFGLLPIIALPSTQDGVFTWVLPPAVDLVTNGGFQQGSLTGWSTSAAGASSTGASSHTGSFALQLSQEDTGAAFVSQKVTLAQELKQPTLSFLYHLPAGLDDGLFEVEISGATSSTVFSTSLATGGWTPVWVDLSSFAGKGIDLTLRLQGAPGTVLVDEVSVGSWETPHASVVRPENVPWNKDTSIQIDGENFLPTTQVYLGFGLLSDVTWVSETQLTAVVPAGFLPGWKDLVVANPDGINSVLADAVRVNAWTAYLPVIGKNTAVNRPTSRADWPLFGYDPAHSGYNKNEPGASLYVKEWEVAPTTSLCYGSWPGIVADGIFVAPVPCGQTVMGLNAQTGALVWSFTDPHYGYNTQPSILNGRVYYALSYDTNQNVHALDLYSGAEKWSQSLNLGLELSTAGHRMFTAIENGAYALNASTGSIDLYKPIYSANSNGIRLAYANGLLYSWTGGTFRAVNPATGGALWSLKPIPSFGGDYEAGLGPVISGNMAVVTGGGSPSRVMAINLDTHQLMWIAEDPLSRLLPYAAIADGVVYVSSGELKAYSLATGALLWSFKPDDYYNYEEFAWRNPVVTQKYIYMSSNCQLDSKQKTYVLDRETHQVRWKVNQGGWLAVANGFLYISSYGSGGYGHKITAYRAVEP